MHSSENAQAHWYICDVSAALNTHFACEFPLGASTLHQVKTHLSADIITIYLLFFSEFEHGCIDLIFTKPLTIDIKTLEIVTDLCSLINLNVWREIIHNKFRGDESTRPVRRFIVESDTGQCNRQIWFHSLCINERHG